MQPLSVIDGKAGWGAPGLPPAGPGGSLQVLTLGLEQETFALETEWVHEVLDPPAIAEVPNSRSFLRGLINVRGKVVPVVDLRSKFGMGRSDRTPDSRIIVMEVDLKGERSIVGLLADRVHEVVELTPASLEEAPRLGMRWRAEFVRTIGKRDDQFIIVVDIDRVFASEDGILLRPEAGRPSGKGGIA